MTSRVVEYIFQLVDKFSGNAGNIAKSATTAENAIKKAGTALNSFEATLGKVKPPPALAGIPGQFERVATSAQRATTAIDRVSSSTERAGSRLQRLEDKSSRMTNSMGGIGKFFEAQAAASIATSALKTAYSFVEHGDKLTHIQRRMRASGVEEADIQQAVKVSRDGSNKFRGISQAEALELASDMRSVYGSQKSSTDHLHDALKHVSFLKSYEGMKGHGSGKDAFKEIMAGIRSAEMLNMMDPKEVDDHIKSLVAAKSVYGNTLKIQDYLTAQRQSGVALQNASKSFQTEVFPVFVQELGQRAGTMLMTTSNKLVAGIGNRASSLRELDDLGFIDHSKLDKKRHFDKKGNIKTGIPPQAITISDLFDKAPHEAMLQLAAKVRAKYGDDNTKLRQVAGQIFGTSNATAFFVDLVRQWTRIEKNMKLQRAALAAQERNDNFWAGDLGSAIMDFQAKLDTLLANLTQGRAKSLADFINKITGKMGGASDYLANNPRVANGITTALAVGGALLSAKIMKSIFGIARGLTIAGAVGSGAAMGAAAGAGAGLAAGAKQFGIAGLLARAAIPIAVTFVGFEAITYAYQNWEKFKALAADPVKVNTIFPEAPSWLQWIMKRAAENHNTMMNDGIDPTAPKATEKPGEESWWQRNAPSRWFGRGSSTSPDASSLPAGEAQKEIAVRTSVDPIKVDVTQSVPMSGTVRIEGTINGPVTGTGTITGAAAAKSNAPRGESAPVTPSGAR
jgi:hypothetical protein